MVKKFFILSGLLALAMPNSHADTLQLKDKAAIVGKVLAEKRDQVAVDVGYTVLVIPRNQIMKVSKTEAPETTFKAVSLSKPPIEPEAKSDAQPMADGSSGLYAVSTRPLATRAVRELVNQLGEAVVQVRT